LRSKIEIYKKIIEIYKNLLKFIEIFKQTSHLTCCKHFLRKKHVMGYRPLPLILPCKKQQSLMRRRTGILNYELLFGQQKYRNGLNIFFAKRDPHMVLNNKVCSQNLCFS